MRVRAWSDGSGRPCVAQPTEDAIEHEPQGRGRRAERAHSQVRARFGPHRRGGAHAHPSQHRTSAKREEKALHDAYHKRQQQRRRDRLGAHRGRLPPSVRRSLRAAVACRHQRDGAAEQRVVAQLCDGVLRSNGSTGATKRHRAEPSHVVRVHQPRERLRRKLDEGRRSNGEELTIQLGLVKRWFGGRKRQQRQCARVREDARQRRGRRRGRWCTQCCGAIT